MKIELHDFVQVDYTGKLTNGMIFDTTLQKVAEANNLHSQKMMYKPATICVGEKQMLAGFDAALVGKEIGVQDSVKLSPENAFGKRDIKNIRVVPTSTFKEHKVQPQPGLEIDMDGQRGIVTRVAGGRVIVNFNHPLAGKEVIYDFKVIKKITEPGEQVKAFVVASFRLPEDKVIVDIKEEMATVKMPVELPEVVTNLIKQRLLKLVKLKEIKFTK